MPPAMASRFVPGPPKASAGRQRLRIAYSLGQFAKNLAWNFTDLLLAYYANMRLGLSGPQTGLLLFLSMAQGGLIDLFAAFVLRRAEGNLRTILLVQMAAGLATAFALLAIFSPVRGGIAPLLFLVMALGVFRLAYAFYDVSQNALLSLLPEDEEDAHHYVVWRQALSGMARLSVAGVAFFLIEARLPTGREIAAAGVIALLIALTSAGLVQSARPAADSGVRAIRHQRIAIPATLPRLLLAGAALAGPLAMISRMVAFVAAPPPNNHVGATLLFALVAGTVVGSLALPRRRGRLTASAFVLSAVIAAALFLAAPRSGLIAHVASLAYGGGLGGVTTLFWREMSLAIRDHAVKTGQRTDVVAFALLTATAKLSGAVSGAALGVLLDGFKTGTPLVMICLAIIVALGGGCFMLAMRPILPSNADARYRPFKAMSGLLRATPPPGSRTT